MRSLRDATVVAPAGPHRAHRLRPPLPAHRDHLTQQMPHGAVVKFAAVYDEPFWRRQGLNGQAASDAGSISAPHLHGGVPPKATLPRGGKTHKRSTRRTVVNRRVVHPPPLGHAPVVYLRPMAVEEVLESPNVRGLLGPYDWDGNAGELRQMGTPLPTPAALRLGYALAQAGTERPARHGRRRRKGKGK